MKNLFFVFLTLQFGLCSFAETIKTPELTPALTNQHEQAIIDEGIALHDQGKFEEAIQKYKQVLEKSPTNVLAMYEMAYSYFSAEKYEDALKTSYEGARYKSKYLSKFYMLIGNCLDELSRTDEAISAFRQALEVVSNDALIHFNLAVTLINSGKLEDAPQHLKTAVQLNPTHITSHYALAQVFFDQGYRVPGTLALLRFLTLEPKTKRSQKAVSMLEEKFGKGVVAKDSKNVEVPVQSNPSLDEGDFKGLELMISLLEAGKFASGATKKSRMEQRIESLNEIFSTMGELGKNQKGKFVVDYYFPYFIALQKNNFIVPFTHFIYQSTDAEAAQWVEQHEKEIQAFQEWSDDFPWADSKAVQ